MRLVCCLLLGSLFGTPAVAGDGLDLVRQHKEYGFRGVAMIVGAVVKSDRSAAEIRKMMADGGLGALNMPLAIDPTLSPAIVKHGEVGQCAWSWSVYCQVAVEWKSGPPVKWGAECVRGKERVEGVSLKTVIVPLDEQGRGPVQIDNVQACWASGGDGFRLSAK